MSSREMNVEPCAHPVFTNARDAMCCLPIWTNGALVRTNKVWLMQALILSDVVSIG